MSDNYKRQRNLGIFGIIGIVFVPAFLILIFDSFTIVDAGYRGVIKRLGAVNPVPLREGFHLKVPLIDRVISLDTKINRSVVPSTAASKDLQNVRTQVALQYYLVAENTPLILERIGDERRLDLAIVQPAIQESVKAVTAQYTAEQLVTQREQVKLKIHETIVRFIDTTVEEKGINKAVAIANLAITDFQFSDEFNKAIELKVRAEQEALQAKNEKLRRVTQAEASAAEVRLAAEASAYSIEANSKARADAIKREADALRDNPQLVQLRIAEKWDGNLPKITGGTLPLLDAANALKGGIK